MKIKFFYDNVKYRLREGRRTAEVIEKVIRNNKMIPGDLNFIITDDRTLKSINIEFLKHNYFTDVIAFDYNEGKHINGEIYISLDTVKRNAHNYKVSLKEELFRVMIHGTLHMCGYEDKKDDQRLEMKIIEDYWLKRMCRT